MAIIEGIHYLYTIRPGDTLYTISQRFGSPIQLIEQTNALFPPFTDPFLIFPGQLIVISEIGVGQRSAISYIVSPGDTLYSIGRRFSATPDIMAGLNPQVTNINLIYPGVPLNIPAFIYEVEAGQTLYGLSRGMGIPLNQLIMANQGRPGFSPDVLFVGYRLIVPLPLSHNIIVYRPLPGTRVNSGQAIEGIARAFEASIEYQVRDDHGVVVTKEQYLTTSAGAPAYGSFSTALTFDQTPTTAGGELWVYARSAKDGRIIDLVQVRVYFT
ncbi:MAG: LysM peptidoglycan-binding domain-containing protein [Paenibacillaceae bacterium]